MDRGRINIASVSVGGGQYCLDTARQYTTERKQFGKAIAEFQNTQFKLADMATSVQASRLLVRHAADAVDSQVGGSPPGVNGADT